MLVSDLYDDAVQVKCPVMLENCWCLATVKAPVWVWHLRTFPRVKSARMYAQVCFGNYLFKLFKKCMSKHPYQYFVLRLQLFKMYILNLNCKLTLQSLFFFCFQSVKSGLVRNLGDYWHLGQSLLICTTVCQDYIFPFKCWGLGQFKNRVTLGLRYI